MTTAAATTIAKATPRPRQTPKTGPGTKVTMVRRRAGLYLRISNDPTGEGLGVERQKKACIKRAKELGWDVAAIYTDNDVGAYTKKPRPEYERMLGDLKAGLIDAVIVWDLDRLTRRPIEIEHFIELADTHGIALASIDNSVDLSTDNGRLFARIKGAVARSEMDRKSARQKASRLQAAEAGRPVGGNRSFGYEADHMTIREDEAAEVRWAFQQILTGETTYGIAKQWNERGVRTATGMEWEQTRVKQMLDKPRYAGIRVYLGEEVAQAVWPAIIDEDTFRAVQALLNDPSRKTGPGAIPRWLLSGIARCGIPECNSTMKIKSGGKRQGAKYSCRRTNHLSRDAAETDAYITDILLSWLETPDARKLISKNEDVDVSALIKQADIQRAKLVELQTSYVEDQITIAQLRQMTAAVRVKLDRLEKQIAAATQANPVHEVAGKADARQRWDELSFARQRALVDALMIVTVNRHRPGVPRAGFDPLSIDVKWRHEESAK